MRSQHLIAVAVLAFAILVTSTIVDAPVKIKDTFAIGLPDHVDTVNDNAMVPRDTTPAGVDCGGCCDQGTHCCAWYDGLYSRCHSHFTPCSKIHFPDGLSADSPGFCPQTTNAGPTTTTVGDGTTTITVTSTIPTTTITITVSRANVTAIPGVKAGVEGKQQISASSTCSSPASASEASAEQRQQQAGIITQTTVVVVQATATTIVPVVLSPVPSPDITTPDSPAATTSLPIGVLPPPLATAESSVNDPTVSISENFSYGPTPSDTAPARTTTSLSHDSVPGTTTTEAGTRTASLEGAPLARASSLDSGAQGVKSRLEEVFSAMVFMLTGLALTGAVAAVF